MSQINSYADSNKFILCTDLPAGGTIRGLYAQKRCEETKMAGIFPCHSTSN